MNSSAPAGFRFDGFRVDPVRRLLFGANGQPIQLKPKVFDVLLYLVERSGELVTKQALLEAVWPHVVVEENNLNKAISALRQALGETRDEHRFIVTEPGRGYRFVASVEAAVAGSPGSAKTELPLDGQRDLARQSDDVEATRTRAYRLFPARLVGRPHRYLVAGAALLIVALLAADYYRHPPPAREAATSGESSASEARFEYSIQAPADSTFSNAPIGPQPTLSPDGKQLAFVAPLEPHLVVWVQTLGDPEVRPLAGTRHADNRAAWPFWSPDGKSIAFAVRDIDDQNRIRLKRVDVAGSREPRDLAVFDAPHLGGAWSAGGTIVVGAGTRSGLYRIPADSGEAAVLTRIDETRGEFSHRFPVMLPDGTRFVYLILSTHDDYTGIYLGSLDDPKMKVRLLPDDSNASLGLGPDGRLHLFFVRDSVLLAQPFDALRGAPIGEPVRIADPIDVAASARYAAFATSDRALVYRPGVTQRNEMVWIDRGGIRRGRVGEESARWRFPALSSDGTKLSALREDRSELAGLWAFDLSRGGRGVYLAAGSFVKSEGALMSTWSPDGAHVVYSAAHPSAWVLYRRSLTGIDAEPLLEGLMPLGKRVRDVAEDLVLFQDGDFEVWVLPLAGERQPYRLPIDGRKTHARISPEGGWLAFTLTDASGSEVYAAPLTRRARGELVIAEPAEWWRVSTAGGRDPQWRRDGRELYYIEGEGRGDRTLMAVDVKPGATPVFGQPVPLFRALFDEASLFSGSAYAPAPDGKRFIVIETDEGEPQLTAIINWTEQR